MGSEEQQDALLVYKYDMVSSLKYANHPSSLLFRILFSLSKIFLSFENFSLFFKFSMASSSHYHYHKDDDDDDDIFDDLFENFIPEPKQRKPHIFIERNREEGRSTLE